MRRWFLVVVLVALVPAANASAQQQPTLALETSISPSPAIRGKPVTFRLEVANRGAAEVRNVRLVLELDPGDRLVATSVPCTSDGGVACPVGTLGAGAEAEVRVTLVPRTIEVSSRFATARSDQPGDPALVLTELLVCTIVGTPRAELLRGTARGDFICGAGGNDRIVAGQGSDRIYGHGTILGGGGDDFVLVSGGDWQRQPGIGKSDAFRGQSVIRLGPGNDGVRGLGGREVVFGGPGNDFAEGDNGDDRLFGEGGKDELHGQSGADSVHGGGGDDTLAGHRGDDLVTGGPGDDLVRGGFLNSSNEVWSPGGNDRLLGGPGRDRIAGGKGPDQVDGGPGPDELSGGSGNDLLIADDGWADVVDGNFGSDRARVDGRDRVSRVERVSGR